MAHNPFTPPVTRVADLVPSVAPDPDRPWQVRLAVWICFIALAVQLPVFVFAMQAYVRQGMGPRYIAITAVFNTCVVALLVVTYVYMYRRHRWARALYLALVLLAFALAYKLAPQRLSDGWYSAGSYLIGTAAEIVNVLLLLSSASNAWFRNQRRG